MHLLNKQPPAALRRRATVFLAALAVAMLGAGPVHAAPGEKDLAPQVPAAAVAGAAVAIEPCGGVQVGPDEAPTREQVLRRPDRGSTVRSPTA